MGRHSVMWKHNCPEDGEIEVALGEPCNWCGAVCALALVGCANAPISESPIPQADVAHCQTLSERHSMTQRALEKGGVESSRAAGVAYGLTRLIEALGASISAATFTLPIAAGYMVTGAAIGAMEARDRRESIVRECLRDKGHKVY